VCPEFLLTKLAQRSDEIAHVAVVVSWKGSADQPQHHTLHWSAQQLRDLSHAAAILQAEAMKYAGRDAG
jgi:hypothetical protein